MNTGTKFKRRACPVESLLPKSVYMHYLDTTEGIPGNRPEVVYASSKKNPFGKPGEDYSESFEWRFVKLVREA